MRILDRYVLQKFLLPFVYCFLGFIAIWFIFDLSDNLPDFLQGKAGFDVLLEILSIADFRDHCYLPSDRRAARPVIFADGHVALERDHFHAWAGVSVTTRSRAADGGRLGVDCDHGLFQL